MGQEPGDAEDRRQQDERGQDRVTDGCRLRPCGLAGEVALAGGPDAAVAPLALLEVDDGLEQVAGAEVRPQRVGHPDLGVGDLPEQEVADPHLAAGPDRRSGSGCPAV